MVLVLVTSAVAQKSTHAIGDQQQPLPTNQAEATAPPVKKAAPLKCTDEDVFNIIDGTSVPRVISAPLPEYPAAAHAAKEKGSVRLSFVVNSNGQTCNVKIIKHLKPDLDATALEAISAWKFQPAVRNGKPVAVRLETSVDFKPH